MFFIKSRKVELKKQVYTELEEDDLHHHEIAEEKSEYFNTLRAPFTAGLSEKLANDLKNINPGIPFAEWHTFYNSVVNSNLPVTCKSCLRFIHVRPSSCFHLAWISTSMWSKTLQTLKRDLICFGCWKEFSSDIRKVLS